MSITTEQFIERAKKVHGNKYDYSKTIYKTSHEKVKIICHAKDENGVEHGEFEQKPNSHLNGQGCKKCSHRSYAYTLEEFVDKSRKIHGNMYDYSKVKYVSSHTPVIIICPKHGEFKQIPHNHLNGAKCLKCENESRKVSKYKFEEFVEKAKKIHGDKYFYDKKSFINMNTKMRIYCSEKDDNGVEHGWFEQTPSSHLTGRGCRKCGYKIAGSKNKLHKYKTNITTEDFIRRAREIHGDKYDYSKSIYKNIRTKVIITCPIHGDFKQTPDAHINAKCGCLDCSKENGNGFESNGELEIQDFIKSLGFEIETKNRKIIYPYEIDILIPSKSIAFEYDGLFWHSDYKKVSNYHATKSEKCLAKGILLFHIFEDEWIYKKDVVKSLIKKNLGFFENINVKEKKYKEINKDLFETFMSENSLQDLYDANKFYGTFYDGNLTSVISLNKDNVIVNFSNNLFHKNFSYNDLVNYALNVLGIETISIKLDNRIDSIEDFKNLSIVETHNEPPIFYYVKGDKRLKNISTKRKIYNCGYTILTINKTA